MNVTIMKTTHAYYIQYIYPNQTYQEELTIYKKVVEMYKSTNCKDCTTVQAISRWLLTAEDRVRSQVIPCQS